MYIFISLVSMDADGLLSGFTISTFEVTASLLLLLELSPVAIAACLHGLRGTRRNAKVDGIQSGLPILHTIEWNRIEQHDVT